MPLHVVVLETVDGYKWQIEGKQDELVATAHKTFEDEFSCFANLEMTMEAIERFLSNR